VFGLNVFPDAADKIQTAPTNYLIGLICVFESCVFDNIVCFY